MSRRLSTRLRKLLAKRSWKRSCTNMRRTTNEFQKPFGAFLTKSSDTDNNDSLRSSSASTLVLKPKSCAIASSKPTQILQSKYCTREYLMLSVNPSIDG